MATGREDTIRVMAEQHYSFHLLVKILREREILKPGEPMDRWNDAEFERFLIDFRNNYFPGVL